MSPFVLLIWIFLLILFIQYILFKFYPSPTPPRSSLYTKLIVISSLSLKKIKTNPNKTKIPPKNIKQKSPHPNKIKKIDEICFVPANYCWL